MVDHLKEVDESYFRHLLEAWWIAGQSLIASWAALIHGVFPGLFRTTATRILDNILSRKHHRLIGQDDYSQRRDE